MLLQFFSKESNSLDHCKSCITFWKKSWPRKIEYSHKKFCKKIECLTLRESTLYRLLGKQCKFWKYYPILFSQKSLKSALTKWKLPFDEFEGIYLFEKTFTLIHFLRIVLDVAPFHYFDDEKGCTNRNSWRPRKWWGRIFRKSSRRRAHTQLLNPVNKWKEKFNFTSNSEINFFEWANAWWGYWSVCQCAVGIGDGHSREPWLFASVHKKYWVDSFALGRYSNFFFLRSRHNQNPLSLASKMTFVKLPASTYQKISPYFKIWETWKSIFDRPMVSRQYLPINLIANEIWRLWNMFKKNSIF